MAPPTDSTRDTSHEHIDIGELMDGSARGDERDQGDPPDEYGAAAVLSGETSDGYVSGQDEGSID